MKRTLKISSVPEVLKLMQSKLWYNDKYQVFYSTHKTNNPQEYWCFWLDIATGVRKHGKYRLTTECVMVQFIKSEYKVKELVGMRTYDIIMIQLTNVENEMDYVNWCGTDIPATKGLPYSLDQQMKRYLE